MTPPDADPGIVFPRGSDGAYSSSASGRDVVAAALDVVAPAHAAAAARMNRR